MFTRLGINHTHNNHLSTNHLFGIPQKETTHYGTYSMTFYNKHKPNVARLQNQ